MRVRQIDPAGSLRAGPHQRHLTTHDVPELRQFVEFQQPEPASKRSNPRIAERGYAGGVLIDTHRPEFHQCEFRPAEPDPALPEKGRSRRCRPHGQADGHQQRRAEHQRHPHETRLDWSRNAASRQSILNGGV